MVQHPLCALRTCTQSQVEVKIRGHLDIGLVGPALAPCPAHIYTGISKDTRTPGHRSGWPSSSSASCTAVHNHKNNYRWTAGHRSGWPSSSSASCIAVHSQQDQSIIGGQLDIGLVGPAISLCPGGRSQHAQVSKQIRP